MCKLYESGPNDDAPIHDDYGADSDADSGAVNG